MAKKHVLIDIRPLLSNRVSGVTIYLEELLGNLAEDKHFTYSLYCNSAKRKNFSQLEQVFPIYYTNYPNKIFNILLARARMPLIDKFIDNKVDIFLAPDLRPTAFSKHIKKIQVMHDFSWQKYPQFFSTKTKLWFKLIRPKGEILNSTHIVTPSRAIAKECKEYVDGRIPVTAITPFLRKPKAAKVGRDEKMLFFIGTLEPRKNLSMALQAFKILQQKDRQLKFFIAGESDNKVFQQVQNAKLNGVHYLGHITEKEKTKYLQQAHALVYLSHYEGFGLPVAEAIQNGTPCLISQDPALQETAGSAGLSVNAHGLKEVVEGMRKILYDKATYTELKNHCPQQTKKWNNQNNLEKWLTLFHSLAGTEKK